MLTGIFFLCFHLNNAPACTGKYASAVCLSGRNPPHALSVGKGLPACICLTAGRLSRAAAQADALSTHEKKRRNEHNPTSGNTYRTCHRQLPSDAWQLKNVHWMFLSYAWQQKNICLQQPAEHPDIFFCYKKSVISSFLLLSDNRLFLPL